MTFLFWNVHQAPLGRLVASVAIDAQADVIIVSEFDDSTTALRHLNAETDRIFHLLESVDQRLKVLHRLPIDAIQELGAYDGLTFFALAPPAGLEVLLVGAHLRSKLWANEGAQAVFSRRWNDRIRHHEEQRGHERTIVVGDLNMNPFESGMVSADGFHATPARSVARTNSRTVGGERYRYFYNPMWNHLGDDRGPPGTFFRGSPSATEGHWHLLDQVLVRPALLQCFPKEAVRVVTSVGSTSLLSSDGRPDSTLSSDHLPVRFCLDLTKEGTE